MVGPSLVERAAQAGRELPEPLERLVRVAALELGKVGVNVCVIHPGWVQTDMGGPNAEITPQESAEGIVNVIDGLNADNNGSFWKWNGEAHGW